MARIINQFGDTFRPTAQGTGVDIASQRQDALDVASLSAIAAFVAAGRPVTALDLGTGFAHHAVRMAVAGATVVAFDLDCRRADQQAAETIAAGQLTGGELAFRTTDLRMLRDEDVPAGFDILYSQRCLHYLRYPEVEALLALLLRRMSGAGVAYLSVAGCDTEYGHTYPDRSKPVRDRFARLVPEMQAKHAIAHPIVTYTEDEFGDLLAAAGFVIDSLVRSSFGNIKAIARRRGAHGRTGSP